MRHGGKGDRRKSFKEKRKLLGKGTLNLIKGVSEQYMSCESSVETFEMQQQYGYFDVICMEFNLFQLNTLKF